MVDPKAHPVSPGVTLRPWSASGLDLLRRCNVPEMMLHLGGPESDEALVARNEKYLALWQSGEAHKFQVFADDASDPVAMVGYWDSIWRESPILEMGWSTAPEHQGKGYATRAIVAALEYASQSGAPREMHAFPSVENLPSNAVCRKAGFILAGESEFEYPPGDKMQCNDWVYDLSSGQQATR